MDAIERKSKEFNVLAEYASNTHGATHNSYSVNVLNAFRVRRYVQAWGDEVRFCTDTCYCETRKGEEDLWLGKGFHDLPEGERLLLWHGSRSTNFVGALFRVN